MICWEAEYGRGREWEKLRFRELNFRPLEIEMPTGHLSKLFREQGSQSRAGLRRKILQAGPSTSWERT